MIFADIAYNPETMSAYTSPITYQLSLDRYVGHDEWGLDKYIVIIVVLIDEQASVYGLTFMMLVVNLVIPNLCKKKEY